MRRIVTLLFFAIFVASCTTTTTGGDTRISERAISERMESAGQRFAWYCGSEGVSLRAAVRVTAAAVFTIANLGEIPDLCGGYNAARAEAIQQIEAERQVLESGLLDLQTPADTDSG